jgi:hypothetical protein
VVDKIELIINPYPPMKPVFLLQLTASTFFTSVLLQAQVQSPSPIAEPTAKPTAVITYESLSNLDASVILQPLYFHGRNFTVRNSVPTYSGSNHYTIDSDFGVFEADGNQMLMRRVAEIKGIAKLQAMSETKEFTQAAAQAAAAPLQVAQDLVNDPVSTISSVPKGIWGFLNRAGEAVKQVTEDQEGDAPGGGPVENISGFSKIKRDLAIKLGVDPYTTNEVFQEELNKVAWPAFLGKFSVDLGMAAVGGPALSAVNWTSSMTDALRDKGPAELRVANLGLLTNTMGVAGWDADAFLNNSAISSTTQTILVAALAQLGNIPGQAEFIRRAAASQDEHDALAFQQSVQLMANLNESTPVVRITHLNGLTVCQTNDGTVVVPIQWDYAAWTPMTEKFITALKAWKFTTPVSGYAIILTGVVSPMTAQALATRDVKVTVKALPGPLQ